MHPRQRKIRWRNLGYLHTISAHFFLFQLGGSSALKMIGRTAREAGNLVDLFHGGGDPESGPEGGPESGPESGPLSLRLHVLIAKLVEGWRR